MEKFLHNLANTWWGIALMSLAAFVLLAFLSAVFYKQFFKRFYDVLLSGIAIFVLSPVILVLVVLGAIKMKGNPFFTQLRPGKDEKIFRLIKFRTMTCEKDAHGTLLPDEKRLTRYGEILRSTSLDELPELFNIFLGQMSIVGPRPLLIKYLPLYNEHQKHRHDVRPGLTGLAQANGRNGMTWQQKFNYDVQYANNITLAGDIWILLKTAECVLKRQGINGEGSATMEAFTGNPVEEEKTIERV